MRVAAALGEHGGRTTGQLFTELGAAAGMTRDELEEVIAGLARAGIVRIQDSVFEKDGRSIPYRKALLARTVEEEEWPEIELQIKVAIVAEGRKRKKKGGKAGKKGTKKVAAAKKAASPKKPGGADDSGVAAALRAWRLGEARRRGVPAFRILSDQALEGIAANRPATASELLAIPGIGLSTVEKYGAQIYRVLHG
jgi:superfamily II DNA helicase RecQ